MWVCRDSRVSGARGAAPCCGKAANVGQRGKQAAFSLCRQALGRAHAPVRVYKCALCTKGIIRFSRPRCVFSDSPALPRSSGQAGERRRLLRRSWSLLLAQCSQRPHPGRSADGCASCVPLGITFAATPFPDFQAAGFSSSRPQSRLAIPRVFFSRFRHGWSLLSVRRHRKRTVDLLGCPDGSIKFSWGYPLKELRSSAPLFISSWIMVAKSFFTLSLSVFAPAFSTYTVLSPNLKVA